LFKECICNDDRSEEESSGHDQPTQDSKVTIAQEADKGDPLIGDDIGDDDTDGATTPH
jgi:hypothetical protein